MLFLIFISISIPAVIMSFYTYSVLNNIIISTQPTSELVQNAIALSVRKLGLVMFGGFAALATLLLYWATIFSHRIVGPIYRLEQELENMIATGEKRKIHFRKHDAFQALADKVNYLLDSIPELEKENSDV